MRRRPVITGHRARRANGVIAHACPGPLRHPAVAAYDHERHSKLLRRPCQAVGGRARVVVSSPPAAACVEHSQSFSSPRFSASRLPAARATTRPPPADTGRPTRRAAPAEEAADPCAKDQLTLVSPRVAHDRHRQPGLPALVPGRRGRAVGPDRRRRRSSATRPRSPTRSPSSSVSPTTRCAGSSFPSTTRSTGAEELRLRHQSGLLPAERDKTVDFSDSYYDVEQAVVTLKGSEFAGATSLADLQGRQARRPGGDDELQRDRRPSSSRTRIRPSSTRTTTRSRR